MNLGTDHHRVKSRNKGMEDEAGVRLGNDGADVGVEVGIDR